MYCSNRATHYISILLFVFLIAYSSSCSVDQEISNNQDKPNILLLVADDLGYSDIGCYGGDVETPNIDGLANNGIKFSRFHTAPVCAPTRAMLLSGNNNHIAGMGRQSRVTSHFGYEGKISDRVAIIPEVLKEAGYHTYMAGKWHLGTDSISNPARRGFEESFINLLGGGNHYGDIGIFSNYPISPYFENGHSVRLSEESYTTDFFTDKLIEYIGNNIGDEKPFFAFGAYTSPHWPLQVDEKYWKKYQGKYDDGYEALKRKRMESLKAADLIPEDAVMPPSHQDVKPWDSLNDYEKKVESRKMELYAGMVDNLDFNIGKLITYLKEIGEYDNTIIVFMSDNGAAANDFYNDNSSYSPYLRETFLDTSYNGMGGSNSFISYGPQWAEAGSAPFRYFKGKSTEGAVLAPMIMTGPGIQARNEIYHEFTSLMDLAPTFYELAGATYPKEYNGKPLSKLKGASLDPIFSNIKLHVHDSSYVFAIEHGERILINKGDWKLINEEPPFDVDNFKLFNLKDDVAELNDLRYLKPKKYQEMLEEWENYVQENRILIPTPVSGG